MLIKSVVQALPTYAMNVFLLPMKITKDIERSLSKFWWSTGQSNDSKIIWMIWDRMTKHKAAGGKALEILEILIWQCLGSKGGDSYQAQTA